MDTNEKQERKPQIAFVVTPDLIDAIADIKQKTGISLSNLGREAIWQKIAEIRATHPAYPRATEPATT